MIQRAPEIISWRGLPLSSESIKFIKCALLSIYAKPGPDKLGIQVWSDYDNPSYLAADGVIGRWIMCPLDKHVHQNGVWGSHKGELLMRHFFMCPLDKHVKQPGYCKVLRLYWIFIHKYPENIIAIYFLSIVLRRYFRKKLNLKLLK